MPSQNHIDPGAIDVYVIQLDNKKSEERGNSSIFVRTQPHL